MPRMNERILDEKNGKSGKRKVGSKNVKRVSASFSESVSCVSGVKSIGSGEDKKL